MKGIGFLRWRLIQILQKRSEQKLRRIQAPKAYIYQHKDIKTKKYLVKEEGNYAQIICYPDPEITKIKKIEGWLKKEDIVILEH